MAYMLPTDREWLVVLVAPRFAGFKGERFPQVVTARTSNEAIAKAKELAGSWARNCKTASVSVRCSGRTIVRAHRLGTLTDRPCRNWTHTDYCRVHAAKEPTNG